MAAYNVRIKGRFVKRSELERLLEISNKLCGPVKFRGKYLSKDDIQKTLELCEYLEEARKTYKQNQEPSSKDCKTIPEIDEEYTNNLECYKCKQSLSLVNSEYNHYSGLYVKVCENCRDENKVPIKKYTLRQKRRHFYGDLKSLIGKYVRQSVFEMPEAVFIKEEDPDSLDADHEKPEFVQIKEEVASGTSIVKTEPEIDLTEPEIYLSEPQIDLSEPQIDTNEP